MLELRKELVALIEWEEADFECVTQTAIDAVAHRIIRMAELLRRMREIAHGNLEWEPRPTRPADFLMSTPVLHGEESAGFYSTKYYKT